LGISHSCPRAQHDIFSISLPLPPRSHQGKVMADETRRQRVQDWRKPTMLEVCCSPSRRVRRHDRQCASCWSRAGGRVERRRQRVSSVSAFYFNPATVATTWRPANCTTYSPRRTRTRTTSHGLACNAAARAARVARAPGLEPGDPWQCARSPLRVAPRCAHPSHASRSWPNKICCGAC